MLNPSSLSDYLLLKNKKKPMLKVLFFLSFDIAEFNQSLARLKIQIKTY